MSEATNAFTPGPWEVWASDDGEFRILAPIVPNAKRATYEIADVWSIECKDGPATARAANAALIAAAPDLYEALSEITSRYDAKSDMTDDEGRAWADRARAALAKATPQSPSHG